MYDVCMYTLYNGSIQVKPECSIRRVLSIYIYIYIYIVYIYMYILRSMDICISCKIKDEKLWNDGSDA